MLESSFFWRSELSDNRKHEIIMWVRSLTAEQKAMLADLLRDQREEARFDAIEECEGREL